MASANNAATCPRSDARAVSAVSPCPLAAAVQVVENARLTLGGAGKSIRADAAPPPPPPPPTVIDWCRESKLTLALLRICPSAPPHAA